jgi:hypothetical protein
MKNNVYQLRVRLNEDAYFVYAAWIIYDLESDHGEFFFTEKVDKNNIERIELIKKFQYE